MKRIFNFFCRRSQYGRSPYKWRYVLIVPRQFGNVCGGAKSQREKSSICSLPGRGWQIKCRKFSWWGVSRLTKMYKFSTKYSIPCPNVLKWANSPTWRDQKQNFSLLGQFWWGKIWILYPRILAPPWPDFTCQTLSRQTKRWWLSPHCCHKFGQF